MGEGEEVKRIPTLSNWAGGPEAFQKLTRRFYEKVMEDDMLGPVFKHMSPEHAKRVAHFIGEVLGGEKLYTQQSRGSHATMVEHHVGKHLDETLRKRWMLLLLDTADEVGLPSDPEFRSAFIGYIEWGSRLAVINSNATENPINETEPMPTWGWGETGGPYV
ncbi:group II truncated hemoglobin [Pseudochryseolinea flava]|uniref:Globin n=1 Tax=Pseudochryseolinea flava TaxID=2059302 RepID=A0A364Y224_9BACT|nr:group II truncated hemoglobin [Pseudochryseolinea flava]RAW00820.1 globin [Pseudochryseolinea flava]